MSEQSSAIEELDIPVIQATKDYSRFKLMAGNRTIDYNHVKRLKREMDSNPRYFKGNPIIVNENDFIIDGQHRRQAAQESGKYVYFVVVPGLRLDETRSVNITQKHWTLMDFAKSYADGGNVDYQKFITSVHKYNNIAPSIIMKVLAGGHPHSLSSDFRAGLFEIKDMAVATKWLDRLEEIRAKTGAILNTPMAMALLMMFNMTEKTVIDEMFDYNKFMTKLERKSAREVFVPGNTIRSCLRSIEDVYNFHSNTRARLY